MFLSVFHPNRHWNFVHSLDKISFYLWWYCYAFEKTPTKPLLSKSWHKHRLQCTGISALVKTFPQTPTLSRKLYHSCLETAKVYNSVKNLCSSISHQYRLFDLGFEAATSHLFAPTQVMRNYVVSLYNSFNLCTFLTCLIRLFFCEKHTPQMSHLKGFSPVWILSWTSNLAFVGSIFLQNLHANNE